MSQKKRWSFLKTFDCLGIDKSDIVRVRKPIFMSLCLSPFGVYAPFMNDNTNTNIDFDRIGKLIEENKQLIGISFYGDIVDLNVFSKIIQKCNENDVKICVDISCNSYELNLLEQVSEKIELSRVTLLSSVRDRHDLYYCAFNSYDDVLYALENLERYKIKVLNFPILNENIYEIKKLYALCREKNIKFNPIFIPRNSTGKLELSKYKIAINEISSIDDYDNLYLDFPTAFNFFKKNCICPAMRFSIDILGDGLRTCKFSSEVIGSIDDLDRVWASFRFEFSKYCIKCSGFKQCGGGCLLNRDNSSNIDEYCQKYFHY